MITLRGLPLKAAVKNKRGIGLEYMEINDPRIKPNEALVRVRSSGICGSDIHAYKGEGLGSFMPEFPIPIIPGHEWSGDIVEIGSEVRDLRVGDRVSAPVWVSCGTCYFCRTDRPIYCDNLLDLGVTLNGSYAELMAVPQQNIVRLPNQLSYEEGALIDPLASAVHPLEIAKLGIRDNIAILGAGPIGLFMLQVAKLLGAKQVIVTEKNPKRVEVANELGADAVIDVNETEPVQEVLRLTKGRGADVVVEVAGSPATVAQTTKMCRKEGQVIVVGVTVGSVPIEPMDIVGKGLHLHGSIAYTNETFERSIEMLSSRLVKTDPIVSHRMPLSRVNEAFELILKGDANKVLLKP